MVALADYQGREQAYVKHMFLELYLEALMHKTASKYDHIVYVDGFAGPWQSANEQFADTSFGIALNALRKAKASWQPKRNVKMSAFLVEQHPKAYAQLEKIPATFLDVEVKTYRGDFLAQLPLISEAIPANAFTFFFIDPKGWRIPLATLAPFIKRPNAEVVFNFMFDFINRAASIRDPALAKGLDELIPFGDFRAKLAITESQEDKDPAIAESRKDLLVNAFNESLARLGGYKYVADVTVLRPLRDRPLYCLCYATRHPIGIEVFRDCQIKALEGQAATRAASKVRSAAASSGQSELFPSLHEMGPDETGRLLARERVAARTSLVEMAPEAPAAIKYAELQTRVLTRHIVRAVDVSTVAAELRQQGLLIFLDWEAGKRRPKPNYIVQRGSGLDKLLSAKVDLFGA